MTQLAVTAAPMAMSSIVLVSMSTPSCFEKCSASDLCVDVGQKLTGVVVDIDFPEGGEPVVFAANYGLKS